MKTDLAPIKSIPILDVAKRLGIQVRGRQAMCFSGHDKHSMSLTFYKETNTWICFGACGKKGDSIQLVRDKEALDFYSALEWFAVNFAISVLPFAPPSKSRRARSTKSTHNTIAAHLDTFQNKSDPEVYSWITANCPPVTSTQGLQYLQSHAITPASSEAFQVREHLDNNHLLDRLVEMWGIQRATTCGITIGSHKRRLVWDAPALLFPFLENEQTVYLQARSLVSSRKFSNPYQVRKPIFNLQRLARLPKGDTIHICEGVPDTIAAESHGLAAVGVLGAHSFQPVWIDYFLEFRVVILADGDIAGRSMASKISEMFMSLGKPVNHIILPEGKDVASTLAEQGRVE